MKLCKTCEEDKAVIHGECYQCHFEAHEFDEPTKEERKEQAMEQKRDVDNWK